MTAEYIKSLSVDLSGSLNTQQFSEEIEESSIGPDLISVLNINSDDVTILFESSLNAAEMTTLDNLVTAHVPHTSIGTGSYGESETASITTSSNYVQKYRHTLNNLVEGDYYIKWTLLLGNTDPGKPALMRVQIDDTTTICESGEISNNKFVLKKCITGFKKVTLTDGTHHIDIDYKSTSDGGAATIQCVRVWVVPHED